MIHFTSSFSEFPGLTSMTSAMVSKCLRLLQTFAGVLQKKIRTRAVFKKTHTNNVSIERLWNVKFEKNNVLFGYSFHKATEAGVKMTDWPSVEFIGNQIRSLMQNNCTVLITKHQSLKVCHHFPVFSLVISLWHCQVPVSNNSQNVMRHRPPREKYLK